MNTKLTLVVLVLIVALALGGMAYFYGLPEKNIQVDINTNSTSTDEVGGSSTNTSSSTDTSSQKDEATGKSFEITYTDDGFTPQNLTIKKGDTVTFVNKSTRNFWPASDVHPTHGEYPTTGGCLGSTFDACKGLKPGESYSFTFEIVGSWEYHDHARASKGGIIKVE